MSAEKAKTVRKALKAELGLNSRQVSVRSPHYGVINVTIKTADANFAKVKQIAERVQHIRRCQISGDILGGGNTYVEVRYDEEVVQQVANTPSVRVALDAAREQPGFVLPVEGYEGVSLSYLHGDFTVWHGDYPQRLWATGSAVHDTRSLARTLLQAG